jgi:nitrite reductase/ring-hydroxylating ferredoxin subunit
MTRAIAARWEMPMTADDPRPGKRCLPIAPRSAALGLPGGWFVAATSAELRRGKTLTTAFMSEEIVLYRTASGEARAISPYCPHLGAHLGRCGTVQGETLRCEFHRFRFDGAGACVATGYGKSPPPAARLATWPLCEQHGVILVHYDPAGRAPAWAPPAVDMKGWSPVALQRLRLRGHPQETTENSVDTGHFGAVHGYDAVRVLCPLRTEGPYLHARYTMKRPVGLLARLGLAFGAEFDVHVHGLGYSLVEVDVLSHGFRMRQFVFSTPTTPGRIELLLGVSVAERFAGRIGGLLPRRLAASALARSILFPFAMDVGQDCRIWEHKRYLPHPALADGDGPIGAYRRWARQFYDTDTASTPHARAERSPSAGGPIAEGPPAD